MSEFDLAAEAAQQLLPIPSEPNSSPAALALDLFQSGTFTLASGQQSSYKIDCDALSAHSIETVARLLAKKVGSFSAVEGVPRGGLRLAKAMEKYAVPTVQFDIMSVWGSDGVYTFIPPILIVDDVITTGGSMEKLRNGRKTIGAVIFQRGREEVLSWVTPLLIMP